MQYAIDLSSKNFAMLGFIFAIITLMKFLLIWAVIQTLKIIQSSEPKIDPSQCKPSEIWP